GKAARRLAFARSALAVEPGDVVAQHRIGVHRILLRRHGGLLHEAADIERAAGLGACAGKTAPAEGLDADNRADDVAVDVEVARLDAAGHMRDRLVETRVQAEGEAVAGRVDVVDQLVEIGAAEADDVQYGAEDLTLEICERLDLDDGRRNVGAMFGDRRQRYLLDLVAEAAHAFDMLVDAV